MSNTSNTSTNSEILGNESPNLLTSTKLIESLKEVCFNSATVRDKRYEGKFVSANVTNLSWRRLSKDGVSLLSEGLVFVLTPEHIIKLR